MEFFTTSDFDFFSKNIGKNYKSGTQEATELKQGLTVNGVFDKTKHWASIIESEGYNIESKNTWQDYLKVRSYSWAKIFMPGYENSQIYFTVGVGSRLKLDGQLTLIYKIDCQRKKGFLTPYQIGEFDKYISDNKLAFWRTIDKSELDSHTWDSLKVKTLSFIKEFENHYLNLVKIVWPNEIGILPKVARLCWNDYRWEKPSGPNGKSSSVGFAFETDKGYGYEEWIFDSDRIIDGFHYGFIQALNNGKHKGKTYDIHLYSIKKDKDVAKYFWVGRIYKAEVLTNEERIKALKIYKERGWYNEMLSELSMIGVDNFDFGPLSEDDVLNVKFKATEDGYTLFDPLIEVINPKMEITKGFHYVLSDLLKSTYSLKNTSGNYKFRSGHTPTKTGISSASYTKTVINKSLLHKNIQEKMYFQLAKEFGKENVGTEVSTGYGTSIDLVVRKIDEKDLFYEVKTSGSTLKCIREALGQILEYAMFVEDQLCSKMIVVGPYFADEKVKKYISHLRYLTGLPIYYQTFNLEEDELSQNLI